MRRVAAISVLLAVVGLVVALVVGATAQGSSSATFNVIFDDAQGLIGGQLVKVAGAQAGTIENVTVTRNFKARVEASIDSKFMPFHKNATCTIRPEGLIAENYVNCDPGTAGSPILTGNPPTVPVQNTTEPVSLLNLFNIFNLPTRERFQVIVDEFGVGTAGRGDDFNDILLRANPALQLADKAIGILARQKAQLASIIDATNTIAAQAASHTTAVQGFLDKAAATTQITAHHTGSLSQTISRLPANLAATQASLSQLDTVARDGTPLLGELDTAVPYLNRVTTDLGPFVTAATPGLKKLGSAITSAIPAIHDTTPLIKTLRTYLTRSLPLTQQFAKLTVNLQAHGFVESFLGVVYGIAASLAREDSTSHLLSILLIGPDNGQCAFYAAKPVAGCSAHYAPQTGATPAAARPSARHATTPGTSSATPTTSTSSTATPAASPVTPSKPSGLGSLLGGLLGGGTNGSSGLPAAAGSAVQKTGQALQNLLNYLTR
jgi:phospholipid/cholesterol/gamma-HCH transport system substrate-binding protein